MLGNGERELTRKLQSSTSWGNQSFHLCSPQEVLTAWKCLVSPCQLLCSGNYGGALGAAALAKGLEGNRSLRELYVNGNSVGDEGVRALVSGLVLYKGKLTALDIGNNAIISKGAHHVAKCIKGSKTLTWISIYMNDIGDEVIICCNNDKVH